MCIWTSYTKT